MRRIYTILLYSLTPFLLLRLIWKAKRLAAYRTRILERLAFNMQASAPIDIWLHAVSVGETIAAYPLIEALLAKNKRILVTTTTPTGSSQVTRLLGSRVAHQYLPYDLPAILKRFLQHYQPKMVIIIETEIWPNLVYTAKDYGIPLILANARLSEKSYKNYCYIRYFLKPILQKFTAICAQSPDDRARFVALGATDAQVTVLGNIKFDIQPPSHGNTALLTLKQHWGDKRPVLVCASTHDNEEALILTVLPQLKIAIPDLLVLIAPRHPERFKLVYELCKTHGLQVALRSQSTSIHEQLDVVILDSIGELQSIYALCDYVFMGGSLVTIGGHNVLEPIAAGIPVITGPHLQNFKHISQALIKANALLITENMAEFCKAIIMLHQDKEKRHQLITNATEVLISNRGAVSKHLKLILSL